MLTEEAMLVRSALEARGLETPMRDNGLSRDQKYQKINQLMTEIVQTLGLDLNDESRR